MDLELNKNEDHNRLELSKLKKLKTKIALGGGKKSAQK